MLPPWIAKLAIGQVLSKEGRHRLLKILAVLLCLILFLPALILLPLSFLFGEKITIDYDITSSAAYQAIYPVYEDYITDLLERMNQKAEDVKEEHKHWVKKYSHDPETGERVESGGHWEYPDVEVLTPDPPLAPLFAYLCQTDENVLKAKKYEVNPNEIKKFYNQIYSLEIEGSGMQYTVSAQFLSDDEIAALFFEDEPKQQLFAQSIELIHGFMATAGIGDIGASLNLSTERYVALEIIYQAFIERGYSAAAAAGACGNIQQECNFDATLGPPAYGIIQWTDSRFQSLAEYAVEQESSWQELDVQLEFMFSEIEGSYRSRMNASASSYASASTYKKIEDPELAAFVFCSAYGGCEYDPDEGWGSPQGSIQGPDGKRWQQLEYRQQYARAIYNAFCGGSSSLGQIADGSSSEKLAALFPSGLPNSASAAGRYMDRFSVELWDGSKKTIGSITMHKALKTDLQAIFSEIADAHVTIKGISGYSWRAMNNGGSGSRSHHSYGVALDIDPDYNPSGKYSGNPVGVRPDLSCYYYTHPWKPKKTPLSIAPESVIVRAFEKRGWVWGAKWGTVTRPSRGPYDSGYHDFMHFSFTGH